MTIALIAKLFAAGLIVWLVLLVVLVAWAGVRGDIRAAGMLSERPGEGVTPERALAMAVFPVVLLIYVLEALNMDWTGGPPRLPDVPQTLLMALTGSNSIYLAGSILRRS